MRARKRKRKRTTVVEKRCELRENERKNRIEARAKKMEMVGAKIVGLKIRDRVFRQRSKNRN